MDKNVIVTCPHCDLLICIFLKDFNCRIFRHGIDPHLSKINCDYLKMKDTIIGCGKPFKLVDVDNKTIAIKCSYDE